MQKTSRRHNFGAFLIVLTAASSLLLPASAGAADSELLQAEQAYKKRDLKTTMKLADNVLRRDSRCARAYSLKAACYMRDKRWDRAMTNAERAISLDPKLAEPYVYLARSGFFGGDMGNETIRHNLELGVKLNPKVEDGYYCLGIVHMYKDNKDLPKAVDAFSKALEAQPDDAHVYQHRAACYALMGKNDLAARDYSSYIKLAPRQPDGYVWRAGVWETLKLYDRALDDYTAAVKVAPKDYNTRMLRAALLCKLQKFELAAEDYSEAIMLNPGESDLCLKRADLFVKLKKHEKALQDINEAIFLAPESPRGYEARARLYDLLGKPDLANRDLKKVRSLKLGSSKNQ